MTRSMASSSCVGTIVLLALCSRPVAAQYYNGYYGSGSSYGTRIGIGVGVAVVVAIIILLIGLVMRRRRARAFKAAYPVNQGGGANTSQWNGNQSGVPLQQQPYQPEFQQQNQFSQAPPTYSNYRPDANSGYNTAYQNTPPSAGTNHSPYPPMNPNNTGVSYAPPSSPPLAHNPTSYAPPPGPPPMSNGK